MTRADQHAALVSAYDTAHAAWVNAYAVKAEGRPEADVSMAFANALDLSLAKARRQSFWQREHGHYELPQTKTNESSQPWQEV